MGLGDQRGFSVLEMLVSTAVTLFCMTIMAGMMVENSKLNKTEQMTVQVHANARNCLTMVVQRLRRAGWDPMNAGVATIIPDADPDDNVAEIQVLADLDEDGATTSQDEQVLIRHSGDRVLMRRSSDVNQPFVVVASGISNDRDGDGTIEPMFVADSLVNPSRIRVTVTARSSDPDPVSGEFIRYTVSSDVALRKSL